MQVFLVGGLLLNQRLLSNVLDFSYRLPLCDLYSFYSPSLLLLLSFSCLTMCLLHTFSPHLLLSQPYPPHSLSPCSVKGHIDDLMAFIYWAVWIVWLKDPVLPSGEVGQTRCWKSVEGQCLHTAECTGHSDTSDWQLIEQLSWLCAVNVCTSEHWWGKGCFSLELPH